MDAVATLLFERQLRGLGIYGHTVESQRDGVRALMHPAVAAELDRFLKINPLPTPAQNPVHYNQFFRAFSGIAAVRAGCRTEESAGARHRNGRRAEWLCLQPRWGALRDHPRRVSLNFIYLSAKFVVQLCSDSDADSPAIHVLASRSRGASSEQERRGRAARRAGVVLSGYRQRIGRATVPHSRSRDARRDGDDVRRRAVLRGTRVRAHLPRACLGAGSRAG